MSVRAVIESVKAIEERFLEKDQKTGDPDVDQDTGEVGTVGDRFEEVEALMTMAQNSALTAYQAIDQLLKRGHQDKLDSMFGEGAKDLLTQAKDCMEGIADLFEIEAGESEEESEDEEADVAEAPADDEEVSDEELADEEK